MHNDAVPFCLAGRVGIYCGEHAVKNLIPQAAGHTSYFARHSGEECCFNRCFSWSGAAFGVVAITSLIDPGGRPSRYFALLRACVGVVECSWVFANVSRASARFP